jgi:cellobiose phosphorylase
MSGTYGHFDDERREFVVTDPLTPAPWINYLTNTRLTAFISQQAGGLVFYREPQTRRLSRYHWLPAPADRPGFYLYVRDHATGELWNPHAAPCGLPLDRYECRHGLGYTSFTGVRGGIEAGVRYFIPPDDVMIWDVTVTNHTQEPRRLTLGTYLEFGLLEFSREVWWCYLKNQIAFDFEAERNWIRYVYHAFEAPFTPAVFFTCTRRADGFECSRDAFCGRGGSLERPAAILSGFSNSHLPGGGHGCGTLGFAIDLPPGRRERLALVLGIADDWTAADALRGRFAGLPAVDDAFAELGRYRTRKTSVFHAITGDAHVDRFVNVWNPLNCQITLERTRDISTDHMGLDGMRYRDTMQDALAMATIDPEFARERVRLVLAAQARDGRGCFSFYPFNNRGVNEQPVRSDNTVWPIFTVADLVNETGDLSVFEERIPFRDGGEATVYEHTRAGLAYIWERRGPTGLPLLFHADWNDGLAVFRDERAESVMLGMQLVYAARLLRGFAARLGRQADAAWCDAVADTLNRILNSDAVWDGEWYRRLLLSNGMKIGSRSRPQGQIYLEPQVWAVISGVGQNGRGRTAMDAARERLDTPRGLMIVTPPYTGIPNPEDPLTSNVPGTGENGAIFCHANTWAVIAECLLGRGDRAFDYYRKLLPSVAAEEAGQEHWGREPYAFASTVIGPARGPDFGRAGISWLTGTASWMHVAATQYMLGVRPEPEGLRIRPCLPSRWGVVRVARRFRGTRYEIDIDRRAGAIRVRCPSDGRTWEGRSELLIRT